MYYVVGTLRPGEHHKVHLIQFKKDGSSTGKTITEDTIQLEGHLAVNKAGQLLLLKDLSEHPDQQSSKPDTDKSEK